jgi:hypothetical protein
VLPFAGREPGGGFARPRPPLSPGDGGRHRRRAFLDALADLPPPEAAIHSDTFNRISGHRNGYATECPGSSLYAQLPTIRGWASGPVAGLKVTSVSGASLYNSTYYARAGITMHWSATTPATLIKKFELLVDGKVVATASGTATSASATLALGTHKVAPPGWSPAPVAPARPTCTWTAPGSPPST